MKIFIPLILLFTIFSIFSNCTNDKSDPDDATKKGKEKCKYGAPTPIFSDNLEKVTNHSFSVEGQKGVENVIFENGVELELLQSGCNEILQSFQFKLDESPSVNDQYWIEKAASQFNYLSTLSDNHVSFGFWAKAILNNLESMTIGEAFEPEPATFIKIDKIPSGGKTILIVTFEGKG